MLNVDNTVWVRVQAGKISPDNNTGRFLMNLVTSVPKLDAQALEEMLNSNMKVSLVAYGLCLVLNQQRHELMRLSFLSCMYMLLL